MMRNETRCYTWTIFQLNPIQQGIQAGHAAVELVTQHVGGNDVRKHNLVRNWATQHKTLICYSGGDVASLKEFIQFVASDENPYPWSTFTESEDFLAGITTSVAMVLPAPLYECAAILRTARPGGPYNYDAQARLHRFYYESDGEMILDEFTEWEFELMKRMNASSLAR
jgi:hypothetical protein